MHTLLWSPAMASGHAGMDEAHRLLFESLGRRTLVELPYWIQLHIVSMDLALAEAAASRLCPAHPQAPGPHPTFN